jgi:hypothetical protein
VKIDSVNGLGLGLDQVRNAHPDAVPVAAATAFSPTERRSPVHGGIARNEL